MRSFFLAMVAASGLCFISLPGCGGHDTAVVPPPAEEESVVPEEGMSEEEYAKAMSEAGTGN